MQIDGASVYRNAFISGIKPDEVLSVSEWADQYRFLSQKASAEPGRWRTHRTPYLREILDCLSSASPIKSVVFMAGAQIGKSETGLNWWGYVVHHSPGPMLIVQPTVELAQKFSKQRLAPMIEDSPCLRERIAPTRTKDSSNTMQVKEFTGGIVMLTGANSAVGLRSMPIKYLFLDEIDAYPYDVDGEGDPVKLAERRTTTFARRKVYKVSTPTLRDSSRIEREYLASDQRRFYVPCPHCDNMDWIRWANIKWKDEDPKTVQLMCECCGGLIDEHHKTDMMAKGEWRATAEFDGETAGFHLSSLYSPLGWKSWREIVKEFLEAKSDPPRLKEWVNTVLGETWEESYSARLDAHALSSRCDDYSMLTVPSGALLLTAGVDVQDNRLAVVIRGWGVGEESWLINWAEIHGDPAQNEVWAQLDDLLNMDFIRDDGHKIKIRAMAIDSGGHHTHQVYAYSRKRKKNHVIPIKGSSVAGKTALGKPSKVDLNHKNQVIKRGVELWLIGVDTIKGLIYSRLKKTEDGDGTYHWPQGLDNQYFDQLTAEKQSTKYVNGFPKRVWTKKSGARNEALDCEVYAYAALQYFYTRVNAANIWNKLADLYNNKPLVKQENPVKVDMPEPVKEEVSVMVEQRKKKTISRRNGGFVGNW